MSTDDLIQLFRLLDLARLRKVLNKLPTTERTYITGFLKRCQREAVEARSTPKPENKE